MVHTGGFKGGKAGAPFKRLPFHCCAINFTPFEDPACTNDGTVYDITSIVPYIMKFKKHPVTGEPLQLKDLTRLTFTKNADGEFTCPVMGKASYNSPNHKYVYFSYRLCLVFSHNHTLHLYLRYHLRCLLHVSLITSPHLLLLLCTAANRTSSSGFVPGPPSRTLVFALMIPLAPLLRSHDPARTLTPTITMPSQGVHRAHAHCGNPPHRQRVLLGGGGRAMRQAAQLAGPAHRGALHPQGHHPHTGSAQPQWQDHRPIRPW